MTCSFNKPAQDVNVQIQLLQQRGMDIGDAASAKAFLLEHNYYRLRGYWIIFEDGSEDHIFKQGTQLQDVVDLYHFDRCLRFLVFEGIEKFEIAFRTRWAYMMALHHGPMSYSDRRFASSVDLFEKNYTKCKEEIDRSKEVFIEHFRRKYSDPSIPIWAVCEIMSLGLLSKMYNNHRELRVKKYIAQHFGKIDHLQFSSWLEHLTVVRNICAHHNRLWNREFIVTTKQYSKSYGVLAGQFENSRRIYNTLVVLLFIDRALDGRRAWSYKVKNFFIQNEKYLPSMGFPENWQDRQIWQ
ncbi:putative Abi-like protein [Advenella mimigardefordensis DPN7]|uniref:Putative Abi-like protein n=2 Tax=Advenella mimigardefordensis TaxID=302406 RepID=W0P925_ADVMD|nr:putative Abi-like protein [Advenella mimigardefordensis DPN7]